MGFRIHEIKQSIDGKYITFFDKTTEEVYEDNGIVIPTDVLSYTVNIYKDGVADPFTFDITANVEEAMTVGVNLYSADVDLSVFSDGEYIVESILVSTGNVENAESTNELIYWNLRRAIMIKSIKAEWKESYGTSSVYKRNELRYKDMLTNMEFALELDLYDEAKNIFTSLYKMVGLWTTLS